MKMPIASAARPMAWAYFLFRFFISWSFPQLFSARVIPEFEKVSSSGIDYDFRLPDAESNWGKQVSIPKGVKNHMEIKKWNNFARGGLS